MLSNLPSKSGRIFVGDPPDEGTVMMRPAIGSLMWSAASKASCDPSGLHTISPSLPSLSIRATTSPDAASNTCTRCSIYEASTEASGATDAAIRLPSGLRHDVERSIGAELSHVALRNRDHIRQPICERLFEELRLIRQRRRH